MTLPTLVAAKALLSKAWPFLLALAVVGILLLTYCEGKDAGRADADKSRLEGNVDALEDKSKADEQASETRRDDDARLNREQRELEKVIEDAESNGIDPRRAYYECISLQQAARKAGRPAPAC